MWLVVLTGLLGPVGVVASWNAIKDRRKIFYSLFLVQQTAMVGVFISLDLMLYYGFWELSLVPMAILIAMYGRKDGAKSRAQVFPVHVYSFRAAAGGHSVALRAHRELRFRHAAAAACAWKLPCRGACAGWRWRFCSPLRSRFRSSRCMAGWLTRSAKRRSLWPWWSPASSGLYSMLRFHVGLFPVQARAAAPYLIALAVIGILYGACLALVQRDFWKLMAFAALSHLSLITLAIYGLTFTGWTGAVYQILNHGVVDAALFLLLGALEVRYGDQPDRCIWRPCSEAAARGHILRHRHAGHDRAAHAGRLRWRVPHSLEHVYRVSRGWTVAAALGVILGAAYMLSLVQRSSTGLKATSRIEACRRSSLRRTGGACARRAADAGDGPGAIVLDHIRFKTGVHPPQLNGTIASPPSVHADLVPSGGAAVNPVSRRIYRILPEVVLTLTGVAVMLLDASLPPGGRAVRWAGLRRSEPRLLSGPACGSFLCPLEPASSARSRPAPSPSSFTCSFAASFWLPCCSRSIHCLKTATIRASFMRSSSLARWACVCLPGRLNCCWFSLPWRSHRSRPTFLPAIAKRRAAVRKLRSSIFCSGPSLPGFCFTASR